MSRLVDGRPACHDCRPPRCRSCPALRAVGWDPAAHGSGRDPPPTPPVFFSPFRSAAPYPLWHLRFAPKCHNRAWPLPVGFVDMSRPVLVAVLSDPRPHTLYGISASLRNAIIGHGPRPTARAVILTCRSPIFGASLAHMARRIIRPAARHKKRPQWPFIWLLWLLIGVFGWCCRSFDFASSAAVYFFICCMPEASGSGRLPMADGRRYPN